MAAGGGDDERPRADLDDLRLDGARARGMLVLRPEARESTEAKEVRPQGAASQSKTE